MEKTLAYAIALLRRDFKAYCQQELSKLGVSLGQLYFLLSALLVQGAVGRAAGRCRSDHAVCGQIGGSRLGASGKIAV